MKRNRTVIAVLICVACVGACAQALASSGRQNQNAKMAGAAVAGCPRLSVPPLYGQIDEVIAAARRLLARGSITVQGKTTRLTAKNSPLLSVVTLAPTGTPFPGTPSLRATATRRCGRNIAVASWAVMLTVPDITPSGSTRFAFLVKTKSGWRRY